MNLSKTLLLFTVLSAATLNLVAVDAESKAKKDSSKEQTKEQAAPAGFFTNYASPICKRLVLYGAFIAYWSYCNPNDRGDKLADGKPAGWEPQAWRKYLDYVVAGVLLYDPIKEDYKTIKNWIEPKWNAIFEQFDQSFATI